MVTQWYFIPISLTILSLLALELFSFLVTWRRKGKIESIRVLLAREEVSYLSDAKDEFTLFEKLFPHPYLAHVQHNNPPAGVLQRTKGKDSVNPQGFLSHDFPATHSESEFLVLLTGGSMAERFGALYGRSANTLERLLNERFLPPQGKDRFVVLNGAMGGWKQPQQMILFSLYCDIVDGIVTLDGYNELKQIRLGMVGQDLMFEYPGIRIGDPNIGERAVLVKNLRKVRSIFRVSKDVFPFNRSYLFYLLSTALRERLYRKAIKREKLEMQLNTSWEGIFSLPRGSSAEEKFELGMNKYCKYIRLMESLAKRYQVLSAYFLQPCAALKKELTKEEKQILAREGYGDEYLKMESAFLGLMDEEINVHSLVDAFEGIQEPVYRDDVHMIVSPQGESLGNRVIAERIMAHLEKIWELKPRPETIPPSTVH